jgi:predicted Zn-dependent protease with MMP-like domain
VVFTMTASDFDDALADSFDELPVWALEGLGDAVVRVEMRPRVQLPDSVRSPGRRARLVIYREPILERARSRRELRAMVRNELIRAVVVHLDLDASHAADLATALT